MPWEVSAWALMKSMRWSWADYDATPEYVRFFCAELNALAQSVRTANMERRG